MARKVALSLMSPANKKARGHKMFMKRLHKSSRWVAGVGEHPEQVEFYMEELDDEDLCNMYILGLKGVTMFDILCLFYGVLLGFYVGHGRILRNF